MAASQKSMRSFFQTTEGPIKKTKVESPVIIGASTTQILASSSSSESGAEPIEPVASIFSTQKEVKVDSSSVASYTPDGLTDDAWKSKLSKEFTKPYYKTLTDFVSKETEKGSVYPPKDKVFTAFNLCSFDNVKVVIIGQDPYHGEGQAHGLCFSVQKGVPTPPSLKNMIQELKNDPKLNISSPTHGNLNCWASQGVLMINTCMTVRKGEPNSHQNKGWETFTDAAIKLLASKQGIVYLLWGNPAQTKCKSIDGSKNHMIKTSHPSPLGAYKTASPFMGSRCFSLTNDHLVKMGKTPIDWSII
eukprot:CAMPEP_0119034974 /NCGR_PEP_ID=MMETSP1177-20130426/1972_1 /TAXON_ID=2985 /ORGANISM="Ochromonas sp, Strain CCMP1899" /LENGTH=302 /DNA_ID=CAMNT_0006992819 /DNA_START=80 /DNA_END=988 /DNA_ORIENTATION=+